MFVFIGDIFRILTCRKKGFSFFLVAYLFFSATGNSQLLSDQYCQPGSVPKYNVVDEDEFWNIEANQDLINTYNIRTQA